MITNFPQRLISLDIFRGVNIAGMIVVNNLSVWTDARRLPKLRHSEWHGCNLAALIFPLFIFIVGVTTVISLQRLQEKGTSWPGLYRRILTRSGALFLLGLVTGSGFLVGWLFQAICPPALTQESIWTIFLSPPPDAEVYYFSLANLRIMGVLQRIALVYLAVALLVVHSRWQTQALVAGGLLLLYWGLLTLVPGFNLEPGEDLGAALDRAVFGEAHLWRYAQTWDPEGLLGTLPAIATGLCGALTGHWLGSDRKGREKLIGLVLFAFSGIVLGKAWGYIFPLNKYLWTSSFVVFTAGYALLFLAFWYWLVDLNRVKTVWTQPFIWLGMNPLLAYCGAQLGGLALGTLYLGNPPDHVHLITIITRWLFGESWDVVGQTAWRDPRWPSLAWAMIYLGFWTAVTGLFYRRRIFLRL